MGGPLRYIYWNLVRNKVKDKAGWEKCLVDLSNDERFCGQSPAKRREFCDRLTYSLVKGCPDVTVPVTELTWNRYILGLVLLGVCDCTISIKCTRKVLSRVVEKDLTISFNPTILAQNKKRSNDDASHGLANRLGPFLENIQETIQNVNHPLAKLYWGFIGEFKITRVNQWERLMDTYLSNPNNVPQIGNYRTDHYSNLKKALCNTENLTWKSYCRGMSALGVDSMVVTFDITDDKDKTYSFTHTLDMSNLKF